MKGFKTYVITKKTLLKAFSIILGLVLITAIAIKFKNNDNVTVFSYNAQSIIEKGTINDNSMDTVTGIAEEVLGFDITEPQSIMNKSSAGMENSPTPSPTPLPTSTPEPDNGTSHLPSNDKIISVTGIKLNNDTGYDVDIDELCHEPMDFRLELNSPEVLIVHTHTTECYNGDAMSGENERTTNEAYNMCKIGDVVADTLESYGIKTIHDKTIHDYPTYQTAYSQAMKTIKRNIDTTPSIKVVLDIHRDAYIYPDGSKLRVASEISGEDVAQVMLVLGTDSLGLEHSNWRSNLKFAGKIQSAAEIMYPGLMRPINLRKERFNMHLTTGSLLVEVGSNGNSLQEAEKSAKYIGNAIAAALLNG